MSLCNANRRVNHDNQKIRIKMNLMLTKEQRDSLKMLLLETSQGAMRFSLPSHISSTANSTFPRKIPHSSITVPGLISTLFSPPASRSGYAPSVPATFQLFLLCIHPGIIVSANTEQILFQIAPKSLLFRKSPTVLYSALFPVAKLELCLVFSFISLFIWKVYEIGYTF